MSIPRIPGFTHQLRDEASIWKRPVGRLPEELWVVDDFREIHPAPVDWVTVAQSESFKDGSKGRSSYLIPLNTKEMQLERQHWIDDLGDSYYWDGKYFDGSSSTDEYGSAGFFCNVRNHHGYRPRTVDFALPFLWFWNAYSTDEGWSYLDEAGYEHQVIRFYLSERNFRVEVRAFELRKFLFCTCNELLIHLDFFRFSSSSDCDSIRLVNRTTDWNFTWMSELGQISEERTSISRLSGSYVVRSFSPQSSEFSEERIDSEFPQFIIGRDPESGALIHHVCDPSRLGSYFDEDTGAVHYLTPVYFKSEVLQKYIDDPRRYEITMDRLSCLSLWGVSFSRNTADLIEVYLGDLGRDLPQQEWSHWLQFNVAPSGEMNLDRFRRDFLNQWGSENDPIDLLRVARLQVNEAAIVKFGKPLWRDIDEDTQRDFERLRPPATENWRHMILPILTLTKVLIDALNEKLLNDFAENKAKNLPLQKLEQMGESLGVDKVELKAFRDLQHLRSKGGVAHLGKSARGQTLTTLGGIGRTQHDIFSGIVYTLIDACNSLGEALTQEHVE
jgi:hypothetical protein